MHGAEGSTWPCCPWRALQGWRWGARLQSGLHAVFKQVHFGKGMLLMSSCLILPVWFAHFKWVLEPLFGEFTEEFRFEPSWDKSERKERMWDIASYFFFFPSLLKLGLMFSSLVHCFEIKSYLYFLLVCVTVFSQSAVNFWFHMYWQWLLKNGYVRVNCEY